MTKLLLLLLVVYLVYLGVDRLLGRSRLPAGASRSTVPPPGTGEALIRCVRCGTHVPQTRALPGKVGEEVFCSEACREGGGRA